MLESEWRSYLQEMAHMQIVCAQCAPAKVRVRPLELYVLEHGHFFGKWSQPHEQLPRKECYANAARYAQEHDYLYAEGLAMGIIPVHHAWCVDPFTGLVHDPTWWQFDWHHDDGRAPTYFGVLLSAADLWRYIGQTGYHSLFDGNYEAVYELLAGKTELTHIRKDQLPWNSPPDA